MWEQGKRGVAAVPQNLPDTKKDKVETRERNGARADEGGDKLLLVVVCHRLGVVQFRSVDNVNVLTRDRDMREEVFVVEAEVGVFVIERHYALVREEHLPVGSRRRAKLAR